MTYLLVNSGTILDAKTYKVVHTVDFKWPAWGEALRWSPSDPNVLYYTGGLTAGKTDPDGISCGSGQARLMRYRLLPGAPISAKRELVRCFSEYTELDKNASYEELSTDGRYIGLVGRPPNGTYDIFIYDVPNNIKHTPLNSTDSLEWVAPSPSGKYAIVNWAGGGDARFNGFEAFDLDMKYLGTVATGHGHGDLAIDKDGTEWYVDISFDNYVGVTGPLIKKNRIPDGYTSWKANNGSGAIVSLLRLDWLNGGHISCQNPRSGWCVMSSFTDQAGFDNGLQPFENEVFKFYLDSLETAPHVERLAHHRSRPVSIAADGCDNSNYWAQPHATVRPDGTQIIFGSNWGRICDAGDPVDSFLLTLGPTTVDRVAPRAPTGLTVR
jgi:hypothetical protein